MTPADLIRDNACTAACIAAITAASRCQCPCGGTHHGAFGTSTSPHWSTGGVAATTGSATPRSSVPCERPCGATPGRPGVAAPHTGDTGRASPDSVHRPARRPLDVREGRRAGSRLPSVQYLSSDRRMPRLRRGGERETQRLGRRRPDPTRPKGNSMSKPNRPRRSTSDYECSNRSGQPAS